MASIAELIDFLMNLMRDDAARREFDQDPDAALADRGLAEVTGQDVRDARLMMTDHGSAQPRAAARPERGSSGDNDAVREIHYTSTHFEVGDVTTTVVTVNDNDTVIVDSFNNDVTAIQDNDTTDVDVISIVDGDDRDEDEGEPGDEEEAGAGADEGAAPAAGEPTAGAEPGSDDELIEPEEGSEEDLGTVELDTGASEGFAPDQDSGFGAQPELGAEAGFTTETEPAADESFDELVG